MSKINDLIKKMCPNGVRYHRLSEIGNQFSGLSGKSKKDFENGNCRYITYTNIYNNPSTNLEVGDYVQVKQNEKQNEIKYKDILIAGSSENLEDSGMISVVTKMPNEKIYLNSFCFGFRLNDNFYEKYNPDFLKHLFRDKNFRNNIISCSFGVTRYNLSKEKFLKIKIPCPPLEVQEEIVKILDKFGELEAKLEAELEARKSQYEFWRGNLLFNPNYPVYKMEDICIINQGLQIPINQRKKEPGENRYFYITVQFLKNEGENYYIENPSESVICKKDDILVTRTGSTGKIVYGVEGCFHNNFFKVTPIINLNKKYLYHVLNSTQMFNEMLRAASGGTVPDLPHKKFYKLEIGLPSIEEQKKIVTILDKFENLISDISIGLPAEIELRRKQYEYYRNKLLSFEELSCE